MHPYAILSVAAVAFALSACNCENGEHKEKVVTERKVSYRGMICYDAQGKEIRVSHPEATKTAYSTPTASTKVYELRDDNGKALLSIGGNVVCRADESMPVVRETTACRCVKDTPNASDSKPAIKTETFEDKP
jgi:hypothetical protein